MPTPVQPQPAPSVQSPTDIWLTGFSAFMRASAESSRVFEGLLRQGLTLQQKTQTALQERVSEAAEQLGGGIGSIPAFSSKATQTAMTNPLEAIFERRLARTLERMGLPNAEQWRALLKRVEELEQSLKSAR